MSNLKISGLTELSAQPADDDVLAVVDRDNKGRFVKGSTPHNKYLEERKCDYCKLNFIPREFKSKFCSPKCYWSNLKNKTTWNKGIPMKEDSKRILRETGAGKCFNSGRTHFKKGEIKGEKCWNWKGGISIVNQFIKSSSDYKKWRTDVFKRDKWTCVNCNYRSRKRGDIQADHIKPFALFPEHRLDLNNGRTLCVDCHSKTPTYKNTKMKRENFNNLILQTI